MEVRTLGQELAEIRNDNARNATADDLITDDNTDQADINSIEQTNNPRRSYSCTPK